MVDIRLHNAGSVKTGVPAVCAEEIWLNPNESCLVQRFESTPNSEVGPAMIGTSAAAEKIPMFSDEEKGTSLKDWLNDIWVKKDHYNWSDEQVAWLIVKCCK